MVTLSEIFEQKEKLNLIGENYYKLTEKIYEYIKKADPIEINFVGCGTSYYLSMAVSLHLNRFANRNISNYYSGSEVMFELVQLPEKSILIGLSISLLLILMVSLIKSVAL